MLHCGQMMIMLLSVRAHSEEEQRRLSMRPTKILVHNDHTEFTILVLNDMAVISDVITLEFRLSLFSALIILSLEILGFFYNLPSLLCVDVVIEVFDMYLL